MDCQIDIKFKGQTDQIEKLTNDRTIDGQTDRNINKRQMDIYKYMQNRYIDKYIDRQKH